MTDSLLRNFCDGKNCSSKRHSRHGNVEVIAPAVKARMTQYLSAGWILLEASPSRPGEFHPEPLTDPCLTVSHHTARAIPESCRPPPKPAGSSCFQLALYGSSADDPPPSLHGHYSASSLLRGDPPLDAASVLSLSWFNPLAAFPLATTPSFPRSLRSPLPGSAHLYAGCRPARKQAPSELVPRSSNYRGFDIVLTLFDTITVVPFRSSSWKSSDPNFASGPFPSPLTTTSVRTQQRKVI